MPEALRPTSATEPWLRCLCVRRLAYLDQISVGIAHVAAKFWRMDLRLGNEHGAAGAASLQGELI